MNFIFPLLVLLVFPVDSWAKTDLCELLKIKNCPGVFRQGRRSSLQSLPSPATAAGLNPANVSFDRGFGIEFIAQPGNPVNLNVASGTGRLGGALISSSLENGFFGNRTLETNGDYLDRNDEKKQYKSKKFTLALGGRLLGKRPKYSLDAGLILKRHSEIKSVNPGLGLSARLNFLTLGASVYQDDMILFNKDVNGSIPLSPYDVALAGKTKLSEKFQVQTLTAGIRAENLTLDVGMIKTKYKRLEEDSTIQLIAASYTYRIFLLNIAQRIEDSPALKYEGGELKEKRSEQSYFSALSVSLGDHVIVGMAYNYFLLKEVSFNTTIFF